MCIIVDANVAHEFVSKTPDAAPVLRWLLTGGGAVILGGQLTKELFRTGFRETLVVLDRAGRLRRQDDRKVEEITDKIRGNCKSDDPHVIAAAVVSGCRLIFSKDKNLHRDAKDQALLTPAAAIYQSRDHHRLLAECRCK